MRASACNGPRRSVHVLGLIILFHTCQRTFIVSLGGGGLSCGPVGPDGPAPEPLTTHLLNGVLGVLEHKPQTAISHGATGLL